MSNREKGFLSRFFGKSSSSSKSQKKSPSDSPTNVPRVPFYSSSPQLFDEKSLGSSKSSPVTSRKSLNHSLSEPNSPVPSQDSSHHHFININRSDHSGHDLGHIISNVNLSVANNEGEDEIIYYKSDGPAVVRRSHTGSFVIEEDDHDEYLQNKISLIRSDGLSHDLLQFYKASDQDGAAPTATSKRKSRAVSMGDLSAVISELPQAPAPVPPLVGSYNSSNLISLNKKHLTDAGISLMNVNDSCKTTSALPVSNIPISTGEVESMRIVHMSDSHNFLNIRFSNLSSYFPSGEIFIHSGNFSTHGDIHEFQSFNKFLESLQKIYSTIIVVLGYKDVKKYKNDWQTMKSLLTNATHVLCHEEVTIKGVRFYGVPWNYCYKKNLNVRNDLDQPMLSEELSFGYDRIPFGVNVLITHGPAYGKLDITTGSMFDPSLKSGSKLNGPVHTGSHELHDAILRLKPGLHLHGLCKDSRGVFFPKKRDTDCDIHGILSVNSCVCDRDMTVMYAVPHVLRATRPITLGLNKPSWSFQLDTLDPNALASSY